MLIILINDDDRTSIERPQPLYRIEHLIQIANTASVRAKDRDFESWPLNRG